LCVGRVSPGAAPDLFRRRPGLPGRVPTAARRKRGSPTYVNGAVSLRVKRTTSRSLTPAR